jgi:formyltetrahydrofolate hydrolase
VLARYVHVMSDPFVARYPQEIINQSFTHLDWSETDHAAFAHG